MSKYEVSAAIGFYRQGATFETIAFIFNETPLYIEIVVKEYLRRKGEII
jgi:hypothetical protein